MASNLTLALLFLAHSLLFLTITPLWEGFDEPFHFGYVQSMGETLRLPVIGRTTLPPAVSESLRYAPVSYIVNRNLSNHFTDFQAYWSMSAAERGKRQDALRRIQLSAGSVDTGRSDVILNYEAQQAPAYYAVAALLLRSGIRNDLLTQVFILRALSLVFGSVAVWAPKPWPAGSFRPHPLESACLS